MIRITTPIHTILIIAEPKTGRIGRFRSLVQSSDNILVVRRRDWRTISLAGYTIGQLRRAARVDWWVAVSAGR